MSKNSAIREFFNGKAQRTLPGWRNLGGQQQQDFESLHRTIKTILDGRGDCTMEVVGQHRIRGIDLPVVRFAFSNAASLVLRDNRIDYVAAVRSPVAVPEDMAAKTAYSLHWDMDKDSCKGLPAQAMKKSYAKNPRSFTFQSWTHDNFKYFVVEFAKMQKDSMARPPVPVPATAASVAPAPALHSGS